MSARPSTCFVVAGLLGTHVVDGPHHLLVAVRPSPLRSGPGPCRGSSPPFFVDATNSQVDIAMDDSLGMRERESLRRWQT